VTLAAVIVLRYVLEKTEKVRKDGLKMTLFKVIATLPFVQAKVAAEGQKIVKEYSEKYAA